MEPSISQAPTPTPNPTQVELPTPEISGAKKNSPWLPIFFSALFLGILAIGTFFFLRAQSLQKQLSTISSPSPLPTPANSPVASQELGTAYNNPKHQISFTYPSTWFIDNTQSDATVNAKIILEGDGAIININLNVDGIGGNGSNLEGVPVQVSGLKLYKYTFENTFSQKMIVGVTDTLQDSLGFFKYGVKTYSITLSYPMSMVQTAGEQKALSAYQQVLDTFKFESEVLSSSDIIKIILELTKPMVWSMPAAGELEDMNGNPVSGTLIKSAEITSKESNKLAGLLVSDSPLITQYGWKIDQAADGMGSSIVIMKKDDQVLITRYNNAVYRVLLAK